QLAPALPFLLLLPTLSAQDDAAAKAKPAPTPLFTAIGLGEEIAWKSDGSEYFERARSQPPTTDGTQVIDEACARAKAEGKLVLWYVHRFQEGGAGGRMMYRAPVLDVYMRQVLFTDPDVVSIVNTCFVPVRAMGDKKLSDRFDFKPLKFVEPAVV